MTCGGRCRHSGRFIAAERASHAGTSDRLHTTTTTATVCCTEACETDCAEGVCAHVNAM